MGNQGRWEYLRAIYERYQREGRKGKRVILSEFCANTGYHRKYAIRLLNGPRPQKRHPRPRPRGTSYSQETVEVLTAVWEAAGYPWSVRLKALLPNWMPWIRKRFGLAPTVEKELMRISPRQMDRRLQAQKRQRKRRIYGRTKPGYLLKHHIPVKTDRWDVQSPGFTEVDLVSHSGNSASGEFAHTLNVTDIHTTWTESRAVLGRGEEAVQRALNRIAEGLPFRLQGVDSDNGSEFINWHLQRWCQQQKIQLTRGRPYKKDDNAHIEQKNWTHVRRLLGWERYDTHEAVEALNDLYSRELRLWLNLFLPSVKLVKKVRVGSKVRRVYEEPRTPLERVRACPEVKAETVAWLEEQRKRWDPFQLARIIDRKLERIYRLANRRLSPKEVPEASTNRGTREKTAVGKWKSKANFHFPTAAAATNLRLHSKCLDDHH
ncbi:MAG TPA: transposase family protein [Acidobacteriaceae bacterium]|nr:transposase family protein [Acidobacteriaceae bacterium]